MKKKILATTCGNDLARDKQSVKRIRSFVCRNSRITVAQAEALETLWPSYGLSLAAGWIDYEKVFNRQADRILEIGFGSGRSLLAAAQHYPEKDFIGIEIHQPGIGALLLEIKAADLNNIRIYAADAVEVLANCIPEASLAGVQIFFPDPWQKRRHHKRRLIQPEFIQQIASKLQPKGFLHLATDWEDYAKHMMKVLSAEKQLTNCYGSSQFADRSGQRPIMTKFELRSQREGRPVWELQFIKSEEPSA